jgi:hypothetical protein
MRARMIEARHVGAHVPAGSMTGNQRKDHP